MASYPTIQLAEHTRLAVRTTDDGQLTVAAQRQPESGARYEDVGTAPADDLLDALFEEHRSPAAMRETLSLWTNAVQQHQPQTPEHALEAYYEVYESALFAQHHLRRMEMALTDDTPTDDE